MNIADHLKERHMDISRYNGVYLDDDNCMVTFVLWNLSGEAVGYQRYNPLADKEKKNDPREGRYYTYLTGDKKNKRMGMWGLESLSYRKDILVIVEGVFDAVRLHNLNIPCVALLSSSYKPYKNFLTSIGRKVYAVEDDHGSSLGPYEKIHIPEGYGDLGEMTNEDVESLLKEKDLL